MDQLQETDLTVESSSSSSSGEEDDEDVSFELNDARAASCMACGERLKSASLLICRDCLGDECEQFLSLVEE